MQAHTSFLGFSIAALALTGACASSSQAAPSPLTAPGTSLTGSVDCDAALRAFAAHSHVAIDPDDPEIAALRHLVATADPAQAGAGCKAGFAAFAAAQQRPRGTIDGTSFYARGAVAGSPDRTDGKRVVFLAESALDCDELRAFAHGDHPGDRTLMLLVPWTAGTYDAATLGDAGATAHGQRIGIGIERVGAPPRTLAPQPTGTVELAQVERDSARVKVDLAWGTGNTIAGELDVRTCD